LAAVFVLVLGIGRSASADIRATGTPAKLGIPARRNVPTVAIMGSGAPTLVFLSPRTPFFYRLNGAFFEFDFRQQRGSRHHQLVTGQINRAGFRSTILKRGRDKYMLWTIIIILLVLWALGFGIGGAAIGNLIHVLLVVAVVVLVVQLLTGRRPV
jgi:uncharacterized membrane protein YtjA (UPF0391 family)